MLHHRLACLLALLLTCLSLSARTDSLYSKSNDLVIIHYDVVQADGQLSVRFHKVRKILGSANRRKYEKLDHVKAVFFDRVGSFGKTRFTGGIRVSAFMRPEGVAYTSSDDGYFIIDEQPQLSFGTKAGGVKPFSIPVYLAYYKKKGTYEVFAECGNLKITPPKAKHSVGHVDAGNTVTVSSQTQTITSQEELESSFDEDEINERISDLYRLLQEQNSVPFSDELTQARDALSQMKYGIKDARLKARINEVLEAYSRKKEELENASQDAADAAAQEARRDAAAQEARAQARQDSIAAAQQQQAEKDKKRNMWMIIGGIVLAALAFVGNQTFQHFRNLKNQKSLMDMQESVVKRAEGEAKRRARSMARNQAHKMESQIRNKVRNKTRRTVDNGLEKLKTGGNKNKKISI